MKNKLRNRHQYRHRIDDNGEEIYDDYDDSDDDDDDDEEEVEEEEEEDKRINKKIMIYEILFFIIEILIHRMIKIVVIHKATEKEKEKEDSDKFKIALSYINVLVTIIMFSIRFFCICKSVRGLLINIYWNLIFI
jgi:magnesium-transporting ATPase (P-type)